MPSVRSALAKWPTIWRKEFGALKTYRRLNELEAENARRHAVSDLTVDKMRLQVAALLGIMLITLS